MFGVEYNALESKRDFYQKHIDTLSFLTKQNHEQAFDTEYTHNSTAIEGNTLSLIETKVLLEDKISVGGKRLIEIYEVLNHDKAFQYIKRLSAEGKVLNEIIVKDIHELLMENIFIAGGFYRNVDVYIAGAEHTPPSPNQAYRQIKDFYADLPHKTEMNSIELAAWTHAEFVKIHPFIDGNGRISRLIMNYQLMAHGFLPISISKETRLDYFQTLESYAVKGDLKPFVELIAALEGRQLDFYIEAIRQLQDKENNSH